MDVAGVHVHRGTEPGRDGAVELGGEAVPVDRGVGEEREEHRRAPVDRAARVPESERIGTAHAMRSQSAAKTSCCSGSPRGPAVDLVERELGQAGDLAAGGAGDVGRQEDVREVEQR